MQCKSKFILLYSAAYYLCTKDFKYTDMGFLALVLVLVLFVLAILSPKIFPNKMLSDNQHDIDGATEPEQSPQSQPGTRG